MPSASGRNNKAPAHKRGSFIQPLTAVIRNHGQLTPVELAVLLDLQTYDWNGEGSWVGQKTIADELGVSERTVRAAVKRLTQVGAIECQRRPGLSNLAKVNRAWVPADPGNTYPGKTSESTPPTPAESAGDSGNIRRAPQQNLPPRQMQRTTTIKQTQGQTLSRRLRRRKVRCQSPRTKPARSRPRKSPQHRRQIRQHPRLIVGLMARPRQASPAWKL